MAEITSGLRWILSIPLIYDTFQRMVGSEMARKDFVHTYIHPRPHECVLDIGCGTAELFPHLGDVIYYGYDPNPDYICVGQQRFGNSVNLVCDSVNSSNIDSLPRCDLVIGYGVLHHLDDDEGITVFQSAINILKPGGRIVTIDPCLVKGQSLVARFIIKRDRGRNVRTEEGYRQLTEGSFSNCEVDIRHDMLRIPFTHIIMKCTN